MKHKTFAFISFLLMPLTLWAHGEETPGPHGGHIKMPGAFHTEIKVSSQDEIQVYLLDMSFKNPSVKDSSVKMYLKYKNTQVSFTCQVADGDHFTCKGNKKIPAHGNLIITATRENAVGNEVQYKLPLKPFTTEIKEPQHEDHNHH